MNVVDLLILAFIGFFLYRGAKKGLIWEFFALLSLVIALVCAVVFVDFGVAMVKDLAEISAAVTLFISFSIIFIIIFVIVRIGCAILSQLIRLALLRWLDRIGGLTFGFIKGLLFASLILLGLSIVSWHSFVDTKLRRSVLTPSVQRAAPRFFNNIQPVIPSTNSIYREFQESIDIYTDFEPRNMKEETVIKVLEIFRQVE